MNASVRVLVAVVIACLCCCCTAQKLAPSVEINLDLPPRQRWIAAYKSLYPVIDMNDLQQNMLLMQGKLYLRNCTEECIKRLEQSYKKRFPDYYEELTGIYSVLPNYNITMSEFVAMQSEYEVSLAFYHNESMNANLPLFGGAIGCTSALTCSNDSRILHGRNLDWGASGKALATLLFVANFTRNGKLLFQTHQIPGHLGVVSGVRLGAFSMSLNARTVYPNETLHPTLDEFIDCMETVPLQPIMTGLRYYYENYKSFDSLLDNITNNAYCAARYSIIGSADGRGARFQYALNDDYHEHPVIVTKEELQCNDKAWYVVETNSDLDTPLSEDDRREMVLNFFQDKGRDYCTTPVGVYHAMSLPKVLNEQTVHTSVMSPVDGDIVTYDHIEG